ncbi:MAG: FmdE family protein [Euryarchaeota archaeon]|nr:FmdE family protein [Euryarchaeota archaeon]
MDEIIKQIKEQDPELFSQVEKIIPFHGYLSTGALIGLQMLNIAKRVLAVNDGDRIYATCETYNCIPDPFQILEGATTGNKGLRINDVGKMAATVTTRAPKGVTSTRGVRIYFDANKTKNYPKLHAWYMNTEKLPHEEVVPILLEAGDNVYSYEMVDVDIPIKKSKKVQLCEECGECFIRYGDEVLCAACDNRQQRSR